MTFGTQAGALLVFAVALLTAACGGESADRGGASEYPFPVQTFEDLGREHLDPGQQYDFYNSNPPTTGPHAPAPAEWGDSEVLLPKEVPVHNMEHGGVVIWYDCLGGDAPLEGAQCDELRDQLRLVTVSAIEDGKLVLMVPYTGMDHRIALTAWGTLDSFDEFDAERVRAFIDAFDRRFNPEGF